MVVWGRYHQNTRGSKLKNTARNKSHLSSVTRAIEMRNHFLVTPGIRVQVQINNFAIIWDTRILFKDSILWFFIELRAVVLKLFSYSTYNFDITKNSKHLNVQKKCRSLRTPGLGASFKKFKIRENIPIKEIWPKGNCKMTKLILDLKRYFGL